MSLPLASEDDIQAAYQGTAVAGEYVSRRFTSELMRVMHDKQVHAVQQLMNRHKPAKTLEIAPGPGRVTRDIKPPGELVCLEFNEGMIAEGQASCRNNAAWRQGNAFDLPAEFSDEFELVYTFRFIRHFHRADRDRIYAQIHKSLKPGGWLVFDAVNEVVSAPLRQAHPDNYPIYDKLYASEGQLEKELQEAGFQVTHLERVLCCFHQQYRAQVLIGPRSSLLCRAVIRTLEKLCRRSSLEWIVTCRRV